MLEGYQIHVQNCTFLFSTFYAFLFYHLHKGGGAIQFVMEMEQKTWVEAVKKLLGLSNDIAILTPADNVTKKENKKIILPEKNNPLKHVIAYLVGTRKLDKDIVYDLIKKKKIYIKAVYS